MSAYCESLHAYSKSLQLTFIVVRSGIKVTTCVAIATAPGTPPPIARFPAFFRMTFIGSRSGSFFDVLAAFVCADAILATLQVTDPCTASARRKLAHSNY
jgi:hypothetical protein